MSIQLTHIEKSNSYIPNGRMQLSSFIPDGSNAVKLFYFIPARHSTVGQCSKRRQQVFPLPKVVAILSILKISTYVLHVDIDPDYSKVIKHIFGFMVIHNVEAKSCGYLFTFFTCIIKTTTTLFLAERAKVLSRVTSVDFI